MKVNEKEFVPNPGETRKESGLSRGLKNWSLVRVLQLGVGGMFVGEYAFSSGEWPVLLLGSILLVQGIFNKQFGCAASGRCRLPDQYTERK